MSKWKVLSQLNFYRVFREQNGKREYYSDFVTTDYNAAKLKAESLNLKEEKKSFIENELTCLAKKIEPDVQSLSYYTTEDFEEYIDINCKFNFKDKAVNHSIKVCVTANSLKALTTDVLKHL